MILVKSKYLIYVVSSITNGSYLLPPVSKCSLNTVWLPELYDIYLTNRKHNKVHLIEILYHKTWNTYNNSYKKLRYDLMEKESMTWKFLKRLQPMFILCEFLCRFIPTLKKIIFFFLLKTRYIAIDSRLRTLWLLVYFIKSYQ